MTDTQAKLLARDRLRPGAWYVVHFACPTRVVVESVEPFKVDVPDFLYGSGVAQELSEDVDDFFRQQATMCMRTGEYHPAYKARFLGYGKPTRLRAWWRRTTRVFGRLYTRPKP